MAVCPKCKNNLKEDFGLETCKKCGEVVFINMDDSVTLQEIHQDLEMDEEIASDLQNENTSENIKIESSLNFNDSNSSLESLESHSSEENLINFEDPFNNISSEENIIGGLEIESLEIQEIKEVTPLNQEVSSVVSEEYGFASEEIEENEFDIPEVAQAVIPPVIQTSAEDFLEEMQAFGEMDSDKFKEGIYFFDIEISNIDSKETRDQIIDALDDSRLSLKIENINKKIINGTLLLPAISAVKAHVIVQKISHLPCEISWRLLEVQDLSSGEDIELAQEVTEPEELS